MQKKLLALLGLIQGELILVDNGSKDGTAVFLVLLSTLNSSIVSVRLNESAGYGGAFLRVYAWPEENLLAGVTQTDSQILSTRFVRSK